MRGRGGYSYGGRRQGGPPPGEVLAVATARLTPQGIPVAIKPNPAVEMAPSSRMEVSRGAPPPPTPTAEPRA